MTAQPDRVPSPYDSPAYSTPGQDDEGLVPEPTWDDVHRAPDPAEQTGRSPLESLKANMAAEPDIEETVALKVKARPGVSVIFSTLLPNETIEMWRKGAQKKKARRPGQEPDTDELKFACLVIAGQCRGIMSDGDEVFDEQGRPLTFASPLLWDMVGGQGARLDPMTVIRKFYVRDAHVALTSGEIVMEAGFGDDVERESPTTAS